LSAQKPIAHKGMRDWFSVYTSTLLTSCVVAVGLWAPS